MKGQVSSILITGVTGFIGRAIVRDLLKRRTFYLRGLVRHKSADLPNSIEQVVANLSHDCDFSSMLQGIDVIIHSAACVHVMEDYSRNPLSAFRDINVASTLMLARQAALLGVRRFVFISSIKVNGESQQLGDLPFTSDDSPAPEDAYAISKAEAEAGLRQIAIETGIEVTIIRPPLVYGPGVKGNFASLVRWLARGWPLPLGAVTCNRRSLVGLDNLVDLILICVDHPKAANQTFLVSDGEDLSTAELLRRIGNAMNRPSRLLPVPVILITFVANLFGMEGISRRMLSSLQVDISETCKQLDWKPPLSVDEGLRKVME